MKPANLFWGILILASSSLGCADDRTSRVEDTDANETGQVMLPLVSYGPSGAAYRLRNATFQISPYYYYYGYAGAAGLGTTGPTSVSSETDLGADAIELSLESGSYYVTLASGWSLEKIEGGVATTVEAQLLSSAQQYLYVSPRSSTWVRFQFGIGEHSVWFNGKAIIDIDILENPYASAGAAGRGSYPTPTAGAPVYNYAGARGY